jgi:LysM repeat protein
MADTPATASEAPGGAFGFLGHKIAGKVPVWVVAVAAVGGYYWYTRYGPGKTAASSSTATSQTDPAGNVGVIDPATGFVYGSPEDLAAISAGGFGGGGDNGGGLTGTGGETPGAPSPGSTAPAPVTVAAPAPPLTVARKPPILTPSRGTATTSVTVKKGQTLASIAAANHISVAELAHANTYVPGEVAGDKKVGQTLGTGAGLKTGQVLKIP